MTDCKWPGCGQPPQRNKRGQSMGFCSPHYRDNCLRVRRGVSFEEFAHVERRWVDANGYVVVHTPAGSVAEHRLVMERELGRPLRRGESVHHKNGVKHDNQPDNLELWVGPIRHGQRATDIHCPQCGASYWESTTLGEANARA